MLVARDPGLDSFFLLRKITVRMDLDLGHPTSRTMTTTLRKYGSNLALLLPPILSFESNFYSVYRVEDQSMEPSLRQGDVILVRKSDVYPQSMWRRWTSSSSTSSSSSSSSQSHEKDALRVLAYDTTSGRPIGDPWTSRTYLKPPTIHESGCVIIHRAVDAQKYPMREYRVRRVIGLGGQICRVSSTTAAGGVESSGGNDFGGNDAEDDDQWQTPRRWADRIVHVPPFALWVEGDAADNDKSMDDDNREKSLSTASNSTSDRARWTDSRIYGAVCKNNVIGIAERIVWPPSRWGMIPPPPLTGADTISRLPRAWWLPGAAGWPLLSWWSLGMTMLLLREEA